VRRGWERQVSYLKNRLAAGETIAYEGRFHWLQYLYAWGALILLGIILIGIFIFIREMVRLATTDFMVTSRRVVLKRGFFQVHVDEITLNSIEGAHIDQSLLGRIFGYGRLTIRGSGDTHLVFPTMAHPSDFRSAAEGARMAHEAAGAVPS
jgi:uncharacterized membrane protein YdbT with pleckstrin-like domain